MAWISMYFDIVTAIYAMLLWNFKRYIFEYLCGTKKVHEKCERVNIAM